MLPIDLMVPSLHYNKQSRHKSILHLFTKLEKGVNFFLPLDKKLKFPGRMIAPGEGRGKAAPSRRRCVCPSLGARAPLQPVPPPLSMWHPQEVQDAYRGKGLPAPAARLPILPSTLPDLPAAARLPEMLPDCLRCYPPLPDCLRRCPTLPGSSCTLLPG